MCGFEFLVFSTSEFGGDGDGVVIAVERVVARCEWYAKRMPEAAMTALLQSSADSIEKRLAAIPLKSASATMPVSPHVRKRDNAVPSIYHINLNRTYTNDSRIIP